VRFQPVAELDELAVQPGHFLRHLSNGLRRADAGHDVLALGIREVLAVDCVFAGRRIPSEADAGRRILTHVAEHHRDDVDRSSVGHRFRDAELPPIVDRPLAVPGTEDRGDRPLELFVRVVRKRLTGLGAADREKRFRELTKRARIEIDVVHRAVFALDFGKCIVERLVGDTHRDLGVQLDESPPCVVGEARIVRLPDKALQRRRIEPQVQDRVHHPGHRHRGAGAHRDQKRIVCVAEALARLALELGDVRAHLGHQPIGQAISFEIGEASSGADHEAGWHVEPNLRHRAEVRALAAQVHLVAGIAFLECVYVF
jgi:hypothetical protein